MEERVAGHLRIGELSQRTGVSPELLRAWERRYGLLDPMRSQGGFRLYSEADEARIRRMQSHLAAGMAAAEAARLAKESETTAAPGGSLRNLRTELGQALESFDEAAAHRVLDAALDSFSLDLVISELLLPYLHDVGDRWHSGELTIGQEHFASNMIRTRVLSLARGWDVGYGPRALLACPPGELHDLGLVMFGLALGRRGWRITFLGANTPLPTLLWTASQVRPDAIVIAVTDAGLLAGQDDLLEQITSNHRVIFAGPDAGITAGTGVELFEVDPVTAAERLALSADRAR